MTPLSVAAGFSIVLVGIVVAFLLLTVYNAVVALELRIDKAWANIDVALKQRHDQLPALVDAVRDVMAYERDLLARVTRLRSEYDAGEPIGRQADTAERTSGAVRQLLATVERYPVLQSNRNVLDLQDEIERLESVIADRRELYNDQVFRYNRRIGQVPALFLAPVFGWRPRAFFAAGADESGRPDTSLAGG